MFTNRPSRSVLMWSLHALMLCSIASACTEVDDIMCKGLKQTLYDYSSAMSNANINSAVASMNKNVLILKRICNLVALRDLAEKVNAKEELQLLKNNVNVACKWLCLPNPQCEVELRYYCITEVGRLNKPNYDTCS